MKYRNMTLGRTTLVTVVILSAFILSACQMVGMHMGQMGKGHMESGQMGNGGGMGMGGNSDMMRFHMATIPEDYAGKTNPVAADEESLERGANAYQTNCATCHGDGGMGDGPAGKVLSPPASPIAHTSQMMGDDYLFWRISEGGVPFGTAMPAWKATLDEQTRWDLINYVRALGAGKVQPTQGMGGAAFDPATEFANRSAMLAKGIEQKLITREDADIFTAVHNAMDTYIAEHPSESTPGNMMTRQEVVLKALIEAKTITQEQADGFAAVHQKLIDAELMQ